MRLYRLRASAAVALGYSEDLMLGLELFDETRPLIATVNALHEPLEAAAEAAKSLVKPRRKAKRARDLAEWRAERIVDELASLCEVADNHRPRGATSRAVFPDGVAPVKAPKGPAQVRAFEKLANDLANANDTKVKTIAESTLPKLRAATAALASAEAEYQTARKAWREAEDLEDLRLSEHRRAMDSLLGELRKLFPGDRTLQNLIVPDIDDGDERGDGGDAGSGGNAPTPDAGPTPA